MKNLDLLDKYFNDSLSAKEQLLFNDLLKNDDSFQNEFTFQNDLKKAIISNQQSDLKSTLRNFEKDIQNKSDRFRLPKKWYIAASIIVLIGLSSIFIKSNFYPSDEKIFIEYYSPYRNIIQPIVRGEEKNTIKYSAFLAYENKNYHKAINLFNSVKNQNVDYISFYKAMCYLSLNKSSDAIPLLISLTEIQDNDMSIKNLEKKANWFLALAFLKNGDKEKAISKFSIVAKYPFKVCEKSKDAQRILRYLE